MTTPDPQHAGQPPEVLVVAIRKLLRPLVRLMLSFQITYPYLVSLLKSVYVEVADKEFAVDNKRQSDSRINLLTGVHRKDVKRLRSETAKEHTTPGNISAGAQLIAYWLGSEDFQDDRGRPRRLPLRNIAASKPGAGSASFDDLVERVCKQDIRPRVILDEWLRLGIAHQDKEGCVVLNTGAFTPEKGFDEKVFFFGKNMHDHISASTHNLLGKKPAYFDRSVYYDKLTAASVKELAELADEAGMEALRAVNSCALALQKRDAAEGTAPQNPAIYRMNFGVFNYNSYYSASSPDAVVAGSTDDADSIARDDSTDSAGAINNKDNNKMNTRLSNAQTTHHAPVAAGADENPGSATTCSEGYNDA